MSCKIEKLKGVTLNGSKSAYGGALQSFSIAMCGLASQIKATATLVSNGGLSSPAAADNVEVEVGGMKLKMQVGGYSMSSSGAGATTLTLNLYDTSNRFLDVNHITLAEEDPQDGVAPNNVVVLGKKFGPLPSPDQASRGVISADPDTKFGDLRAFYEKEMPSCPEETSDGRNQRVDDGVRGSTGKTLYTASALRRACGAFLAAGGAPFSESTLVDFRGTAREVLVQFANSEGYQTWWDMEKEEVHMVQASSASEGFAKMGVIAAGCEIISSSQTTDFTTTLGKGAIGQVTSSFQGENQSTAGREMSRFLTAVSLEPEYKYTKCKDKGSGVMSELTFSTEVLKALQAAADPMLFAAYALQSAISNINAADHQDICAAVSVFCPELTWSGKENTGPGAFQDITTTRTLGPGEWQQLLPVGDTSPAYQPNTFLSEYYKSSAFEPCASKLAIVKLADLGEAGEDLGIPLESEANSLANGAPFFDGPKDTTKTAAQTPDGWNFNTASEPFKSMGKYSEGQFEDGHILMQLSPYFDSIIGPGGLRGQNDVLRQYLLAIQRFRGRFAVIKKNGLSRVKDCDVQSIGVKGKSYGYYISSQAQGSPLSFKVDDGYKVVPIDPFCPLGECSCEEIKDLAQVLALMYLPTGKSLASVMGRRADPDNPIKGLREGSSGAAVIDFIYALQSDGKIDVPKGQKQGLEEFFNGKAAGAEPVRRAKFADEEDKDTGKVIPRLSMYLVVAEQAGLTDLPQIQFLANADQQEGQNKGELQPASTVPGPAITLAKTLVSDLSGVIAGTNDIKGLKGLTEKSKENEMAPLMWGLNSSFGGEVLDLNGTVPDGYFKVNGENLMAGEQFIPPASINPPGPESMRAWFRVQGAQNSFGNSSEGEFSLSAAVTPAENCWKQKYDFGVSVNGADIGRDNVTGQSWPANELDMANPYSAENKAKMLNALYKKLNETAVSDTEASQTQSITFLLLDGSNPQLPNMSEGLESLQISVNGSRTEVSVTVGNATVKGAQKAMAERMVQSPSTLYRPANLMGSSVFEETTPRFQNLMKGR